MNSSVALLAVLGCAALALAQQDYSGPRPPKPDLPYLMHAGNLVETETSEAREEQRKSEVVYTIAGAASPVRTPLAEPVFLFQSDKLAPDSLGLFRLEVKGGSRQVVLSKKKRDSHPLRLTVTRLADRLYRVEVNEGLGLGNGEYSLSPEGSNQAFCFAVY
ncbi:MAG: hypothetical protein ABSH05_02315 [Bryobacteraceae bacterium]|jgi:hypothetical protein